MTGFGLSELKTPQGFIRVEIKTVNHKFLEITSRLPGHLSEFEDGIRKTVSEKIRRGKVMVFVSAPDPALFAAKLFLNESLAREVHQKILRLKNVLGLEKTVSADAVLKEVLHYPEVLTKDSASFKKSAYAKDLLRAVAQAVESLDASKLREGRALEKDFKKRIAETREALKIIEKRIPANAKEYRDGLGGRMKDFLKDEHIDAERLTQEVAQFLKNGDISEEVTRLGSHLGAMTAALRVEGETGRRLDFIGQEMLREANTIGSKSSDVAIANAVISLKSAIEKIREQSQNVE